MRAVRCTDWNEFSSRSHTILQMCVEQRPLKAGSGKPACRAKLNLVDLAGSEKIKPGNSSGMEKAQFREMVSINQSLSALAKCITALTEPGRSHVPYRDSVLTRLLQDSLGGNTKTVMISAISPADYNYEETLSTLRYANRAKNIKNKPTVNEE